MRAVEWAKFVLITIAASGWFGGCGGDDDSDDGRAENAHVQEELPEVDCSGTVPAYADVEAFKPDLEPVLCLTCHTSANTGPVRRGAPDDVNFDTEEAAIEMAEEIAHEVFEGEMPPPDSGIVLTDEQKEQLYLWALCM